MVARIYPNLPNSGDVRPAHVVFSRYANDLVADDSPAGDIFEHWFRLVEWYMAVACPVVLRS